MITKQYNPSQLEIEIAEAIAELSSSIESKLSNCRIVSVENKITADNPLIRLKLVDNDDDPHEVVLKIIQKPDQPHS